MKRKHTEIGGVPKRFRGSAPEPNVTEIHKDFTKALKVAFQSGADKGYIEGRSDGYNKAYEEIEDSLPLKMEEIGIQLTQRLTSLYNLQYERDIKDLYNLKSSDIQFVL